MKTNTQYNTITFATNGVVFDYVQLIKPRLTSLVVITALGSYLIACDFNFSIRSLIILAIGGFCITGASNAINQVLEKDYDKLMVRTASRPLAANRMTTSSAVLFAGLLCMIGVTALGTFNMLSSFFGMLAFVLYAFVYTPLKRYSRSAVTIGGIAGAMPMVIGVVAFEGEVTILALFLFMVQFLWQFPHFWAIGFLSFKDYKNAGFRFVPVGIDGTTPSKSIAYSSLISIVLIIVLTAWFYYLGNIELYSFVMLSFINLMFMLAAIRFVQLFDAKSAKQLMLGSLAYIPLVLIILIINGLMV